VFMTNSASKFIWVFVGNGGPFPSAVFSSKQRADDWIGSKGLFGVFTLYELDVPAIERSLALGTFRPRPGEPLTADKIGRFAGGEAHWHYENGKDIHSGDNAS